MATLSGPMFEPAEDEHRKSVFGKMGGHYNIFVTRDEEKALEFLKSYFPDGEANELNFVLFSTSGVHGSYATLEEIEASLLKYGSGDEEGPTFDPREGPPDDWCPDSVTFLLVQPRIVSMTYGNVRVTLEGLDYLKRLRDSSWKAVQGIGK